MSFTFYNDITDANLNHSDIIERRYKVGFKNPMFYYYLWTLGKSFNLSKSQLLHLQESGIIIHILSSSECCCEYKWNFKKCSPWLCHLCSDYHSIIASWRTCGPLCHGMPQKITIWFVPCSLKFLTVFTFLSLYLYSLIKSTILVLLTSHQVLLHLLLCFLIVLL